LAGAWERGAPRIYRRRGPRRRHPVRPGWSSHVTPVALRQMWCAPIPTAPVGPIPRLRLAAIPARRALPTNFQQEEKHANPPRDPQWQSSSRRQSGVAWRDLGLAQNATADPNAIAASLTVGPASGAGSHRVIDTKISAPVKC
jgi:hypothetical protein